VSDLDNLVRFDAQAYRDGYLQSQVRGGIAYQIQALRDKTGLTQVQFAEKTGKKQSTISRLEDTEYGRVSVQTLLDIACALNIALIVRFVSYPEFLAYASNMSVAALQPDTIQESIERERNAKQVARISDEFAKSLGWHDDQLSRDIENYGLRTDSPRQEPPAPNRFDISQQIAEQSKDHPAMALR
jgi:transcriptional regulator with XRE-family HTH domain